MKKQGFTLIELLAVIIILAVIALIATPMIMNYVEDARDGALKTTARNIIEVAETEYTKQLAITNQPVIQFSDLKYSGEKIEDGALSFDDDGLANLAIYKDNKCVYRYAGEEEILLDKVLTKEECLGKFDDVTAINGVELLLSKANDSSITSYTAGNKGEMYTFSHPATVQTGELTDYRYIGNVPNNYITFNNETWRIIGVFDRRIKIVKDTSIGNLSWDSKQSGVGSSTGSGSNDWTDSQLMYMLNPTSFSLKEGYTNDGTYIRDANNKIVYQLGCLPEETDGSSYNCTANTWSLDATALSQVDSVTWYLGGMEIRDYNYEVYEDISYSFERGTTVYSGRQASWQGKVGLMYPSDYLHTYAYGVNDQCLDLFNCFSPDAESSWLYSSKSQWFISPFSHEPDWVFFAYGLDGLYYAAFATLQFVVRPTVHLRPDIKLTGTGTSTDPYQIVTD